MTNEENPFAKRERERNEEYKRYGIDDLRAIERSCIIQEAMKRISDNNITEEDEKHKVYTEVKQLYFEYKQAKETQA